MAMSLEEARSRKRLRNARLYRQKRLEILARQNRYNALNRDKRRLRAQAYYLKNKERILARGRAYYQANKEQHDQWSKDYAKRRPDVMHKVRLKRRLRIQTTIESEQAISSFILLIRTSRWVYCYYCDKRISGKKAHIEHMVPLVRGGRHAPDNLCASCGSCNSRKSTKLISEWRREGQQILSL